MDSERQSMLSDDELTPDINGREEPAAQTQRGPNLLRERTFNEELKNILQKIRENEGPGAAPPLTIDDISRLTEEEFQVALHSLFYKIKNAGEIIDSSVDFDPYDSADIAETPGPVPWEKTLDERMKSAGFAEYALLGYDFGRRAFVPCLGSMNMEMENIAISLRDGLYRQIREGGQGLYLESSSIEVDDWHSKLFRPTDGNDYALYFVRSGALTARMFDSFTGPGDTNGFPMDEKILAIRFIDTPGLPRPADLCARLERDIAVPLALSIGSRTPEIKSLGLDEIDIQTALVEYLLAQYSYSREGLYSVISVNKFREKEIFFIIKYLIAKLKKGLWKYSSIVQISGTCILVLSKQKDEGFINETISEINRYYNDIFQIDFLDSATISDPVGHIHALFMR